jgi:uncharacterized protein (TIGR02611 family)
MSEDVPDERSSAGIPPTKAPLTSKVIPIRAWFHTLPGGQTLFRTLVGLVGLVFVVLGLALVPLPGPGWLIVIAGIGVWAIEFVWARSLLRLTHERLYRWNAWQREQHWLVRALLLSALIVTVVTALWLSLKHGFGIDPTARLLDAARYVITSG